MICRAVLILMCGVGMGSPITGLVGCAAALPPVQPGLEASFLTVEGDWNDVEAAAIVAAEQAELVIEETEKQELVATFRVRTVGGESGVLRAQRRMASEASGPIQLSAAVGLFRHPEVEHRLLHAMAKRLRQLAGVEYAPL